MPSLYVVVRVRVRVVACGLLRRCRVLSTLTHHPNAPPLNAQLSPSVAVPLLSRETVAQIQSDLATTSSSSSDTIGRLVETAFEMAHRSRD